MQYFEQFKSKVEEYFPLFIKTMVFAVVIYFVLMANQLTNPYDGLWEYSDYTAGRWELSLGRWVWLYLDRLRMGISVDPLTSLITLACFTIGMLLIIDLFGLRERKISYLIVFLFISSASVCISLSYRYMSPTFGMAFLCNVFAGWILFRLKNVILAVLSSAVFIGLGMGLYQANIGCAGIVILGALILLTLRDDQSVKSIMQNVGKAAAAVCGGGVLYIAGLKVHLAVFGLEMSTYNGGSTYSIGNTLRNFPVSLKRTYNMMSDFYLANFYKSNVFQEQKIYLFVFICVGLLLLRGVFLLWKKNPVKAVIYLIFLALVPPACNAVMFIATDTGVSMQMTASISLAIPVMLCVDAVLEEKGKVVYLFRRATILLMAVVLYGSIYQVQLDQNAMLEGKIATTTLAQQIVDEIEEYGYLNVENCYCIVGLPVGNPLFDVSDMYSKANTYAAFGAWWSDPNCTRRSWQSVFSHLCGVNIPICSTDEYRAILAEETVQNMPIFPEEGCIMEVNGIIVVRVG